MHKRRWALRLYRHAGSAVLFGSELSLVEKMKTVLAVVRKTSRGPKHRFHRVRVSRSQRKIVFADIRSGPFRALLECRNEQPAKALERRGQNLKPVFEMGRAAQYPNTADQK